MLSGDENKPIGKSGQRKKNTRQQGKKADPRREKSAQPQELQQDHLQGVPEVVEVASAPVFSTEEPPTSTPLPDSSPVESPPTIPAAAEETVPVPSAEAVPVSSGPVSYQAIANAYCNYTLQSLDQTRSFFEKLAAVRSPNKAFELQTEFAKQACDAFVTGSQTISELHGKLAAQRLKRWEDFVARAINPSRNLTGQA